MRYHHLSHKSECNLHATLKQRRNAINALSDRHSISIEVNRSTCCKHLRHQPYRRRQENMEIRKRTLEIYARSDKQLGVRKMPLCLAREHCMTVSEGWVYQLMRQMKLLKMSTMKSPKAAAGKENTDVFRNLLSQRFDQKAPNLVWVSDFTCVKVGGRFRYICAILDLYAGKVIACRVGSKFDRFPVIDILWDAVRRRGVSKGLIFHADQGAQFTSRDFRMVIDELGIIQSFSAKGHLYNNAVMECFFKYLKKEELDRRCFQSLEQFKWSLLPCISGFFTHSLNRGLPPILAENLFLI